MGDDRDLAGIGGEEVEHGGEGLVAVEIGGAGGARDVAEAAAEPGVADAGLHPGDLDAAEPAAEVDEIVRTSDPMTAASAECLAAGRRGQLGTATGIAAVMPGFDFECGHEKSFKSSVVSSIFSPCYPLRGLSRMAPHGPGRLQLPKANRRLGPQQNAPATTAEPLRGISRRMRRQRAKLGDCRELQVRGIVAD